MMVEGQNKEVKEGRMTCKRRRRKSRIPGTSHMQLLLLLPLHTTRQLDRIL
jgi:hypothetical protein